MSETLNLQDDHLQNIAELFTEAASTQNISRSMPTVETYTHVGESIAAFFHAVVIAGEALSDSADIAANNTTEILAQTTHTDKHLAQGLQK